MPFGTLSSWGSRLAAVGVIFVGKTCAAPFREGMVLGTQGVAFNDVGDDPSS